MYYKDSPYGQTPQTAYFEGAPNVRAPLLPPGYGNVDSGKIDIKEYLTNPWVIAITVILIVIVIAWLTSKEGYRHY